MIAGTKISQLPVETTLLSTDFIPFARGSSVTRRVGALTLINYLTGQNLGNGSGLFVTNNTGTLQFKTLSATGGLLSISTNTDTVTINGEISPGYITDTLLATITASNKVSISAIAPFNSLSGDVLVSTGSATPPIWLPMPIDATSSNIPNRVVSRDLSGNFFASTITANLSGNASTASRWQTARTVTLSGIILGSFNLDGNSNVTLINSLSTGVIQSTNIADNANIEDYKLGYISSEKKVSSSAIDYTGTNPGQVLTTTGSATPPTWQNLPLTTSTTLASGAVTTEKIVDFSITTRKISDTAITTSKLSAEAVTTATIAPCAITTQKIADGAVTPIKTNATPAAVGDTLVSRDTFGNLSAVEVTANLKGNAATSTKWATPISFYVGGDIYGGVSLDGSQNVLLTAYRNFSIPKQVIFDSTVIETVTGIYTQGSVSENSNLIYVTSPSSTQIKSVTGIYIQGEPALLSNFITLQLTGTYLQNYLLNNFLVGSSLTATFLSGVPLSGTFTNLTNGQYIVITSSITEAISTAYVSISTSILQAASGNVIVTYNEITPSQNYNVDFNDVLYMRFTENTALSGTIIPPTSGLYSMYDIINNFTYVLSSSVAQSASGIASFQRCSIKSTNDASTVTYIEPGHYFVGFESAFNTANYGYTGSARLTGDSLATAQIQTFNSDLKTDGGFEFRTILNDGTLKQFNSSEVSLICFE